jgi:hypothetical protein
MQAIERSLQNTFNYLTEDHNHQEYSFDQVNTILVHSLQELPVDAVWGQIDPLRFSALKKHNRSMLTDAIAEDITPLSSLNPCQYSRSLLG